MSSHAAADPSALPDSPGDFLRAFESGTLEGDFHHHDHVYAAWLLLRQQPLEEVLGRYTRGIQRLAEARGADGLYHQTITWTYLFAIRERLAAMAEEHTWADFRARHPELFEDHRRFLGRYYSAEVLDSELARRTFILPDPGARHAA